MFCSLINNTERYNDWCIYPNWKQTDLSNTVLVSTYVTSVIHKLWKAYAGTPVDNSWSQANFEQVAERMQNDRKLSPPP